ncbi:MAG: peptide chain release factor 3, partial [Betaproteobacteria bacterium]|nr:peptide chain release factor 3 [Betaproteobacteria bacterium]
TELQRFVNNNSTRVALDAADTYTYLLTTRYDLQFLQERWPRIQFHPLREHAGLVLEAA